MKLVLRHSWELFQVLPTLWCEIEECEDCGRTGISINIGWLFWAAGILFHMDPKA
jgi:hypothetical protein